jgi:APA family basic amino acid/polyamine antiporter
MSGIIALGLLASISALIWAGPSVTQRVGEDYPFFARLAKTRDNIPVKAILLQLMLVLGLIAFDSFETILVFAQIPLLLCLMLGVIGLIILRKKGADLQMSDTRTSFRCPLYPLPPMIFILSALAGLSYSAATKPWIALAGTVLMLIPLFLHRWISPKHPS